MNENNNNGPQNPTGTPNGQENKNNNTPIGDNVQKNNNSNAPKNDNNDGKTGARKEHDDREHQHDYKTPKAEQTDQEINDIDTENKNPGVNKNEESGPDSKTKHKGL